MILSMNGMDSGTGQVSPHYSTVPPYQSNASIPAWSQSAFVSPTSSGTSLSSSDSTKRGREDGANNTQHQDPVLAPPFLPPDKKSRANNYIAPHTYPNTFTSTMGTLVSSHASLNWSSSLRSVPLRRQLSGSQLESFLGDHDDMDVDVSEQRPRSMSF